MKISAIRVAECGRFSSPVALEGLSGGLDVLIGPNEAGKSTLLRAMRLAFVEKHRSNKAEIRDLQPYAGGAPLVEVEFEIGGVQWRLRKRFLSERTAELSSVDNGKVFRGSDAETELEKLFAATGIQSRLDLLWLTQGSMTDARREPLPEGRDLVRRAVTQEIALAAVGDGVRRLRKDVTLALAALVSSRTKRGRYGEADAAAKDAAARLAEARRRAASTEALLGRLDGVVTEAARLASPGAASDRRQRLAKAETVLKEAQENAVARGRAEVAVVDARARHQQAKAARQAFEKTLADIDRFSAVDREEAAATACHHHARERALASQNEALAKTRETSARLQACEAELALARAQDLRDTLVRRRDRARGIAASLAEVVAQQAGGEVTSTMVAEARRLDGRISTAQARIEAQSAIVTVSLIEGGAGRIRLDDEALADGTRFIADKPLDLEIVGVGRIRIEPASDADRLNLADALARDRQSLAALLGRARVKDVHGLEARYEQQRQLATHRDRLESDLATLAPGGMGKLEAELNEAENAIADRSAGSLPARPASEIELELQDLRRLAETTSAALAGARDEVARLELEEASRTARAEERKAQREALARSLPPDAEIEKAKAQHAAEDKATSIAYDEALRIHSAWEARTPDAQALTQLSAEVEAARSSISKADRELAVLAEQRSRIEGELDGMGTDEPSASLADLEAEAERTHLAVADIELEIAALRLLEAELGQEEEHLKARYQAPVLARLEPYLQHVFPGGRIVLGDDFETASLARGNHNESATRLSEGTREQIAVLVRLGFGKLLADQGLGCPLVLDDALVYSDDVRIAAMHRALESAAGAHQVIVLTCRAQSFAGLGGHRVSLSPWRP